MSTDPEPPLEDEPIDATAEGVVSVWIGATIDESELTACFETEAAEGMGDCDFAQAFGLQWIDPNYIEVCFEPAPTPIANLLQGASFAGSFANAVEAVAHRMSCTEANAVVLLYDVNYAPPERPDGLPDYPLTFVGAFPYELDTEDSSE